MYRFSSKIEVFSLFWNPWWQNLGKWPLGPKNTKIEVSPHQVYVKTCGSHISLHSSWQKCCWKDFEKYWLLFEIMDFSFFSLCDSRKTTKSADFGLFFDFACFQASFDVFCMRWDVRNIILEVQTMGSEGLQACKHSKFHLSRPFWRQKSLLHCLHWDFTIFDFRRGLMEGSVFCKIVRD